MKLPAAYTSVTLSDDLLDVAYPPLGFYPFAEHALGNGDEYGLYWPIGCEDEEPIVAETLHDGWVIEPRFSSLDRFLSVVDENEDDEDYVPDTPTLEEDSRSPAACLQYSRAALKANEVDKAIQSLETTVSILPEYTDAQALLCTQHRRIGEIERAIEAAIQAIISPPCFGATSPQISKWFAALDSCPAKFESDPIWVNRNKLTLQFGGVKENEDYIVLRKAIDTYLDQSAFVRALTLMQTYAELMWKETVSFMERYDFDVKEFVTWQREVAEKEYGKSRILRLPQ